MRSFARTASVSSLAPVSKYRESYQYRIDVPVFSLSGALWVAGSFEPGDRRLLWWLPALAVELLAPAVGYATPLLGRSLTSDYDVEGGHFALVSQGFPQLVRVSSDVVRPDNSRVFPERMPVICQIRMVNETPLVPDLERLEEMIADETSIGA